VGKTGVPDSIVESKVWFGMMHEMLGQKPLHGQPLSAEQQMSELVGKQFALPKFEYNNH
jgi:hypothetical protein